jgi:hypothetical protein
LKRRGKAFKSRHQIFIAIHKRRVRHCAVFDRFRNVFSACRRNSDRIDDFPGRNLTDLRIRHFLFASSCNFRERP